MTTQHPYGAPNRMLDIPNANVRLPYWCLGQGPDLVFIHGWPMDARTWRHNVSALSAHFTCHLIDLPCCGLSEWSEETVVGLPALAQTVVSAVDAMDLRGQKLGLIGQDIGGTCARLTASIMPERIAGIALANTEIPHHPSLRVRLLFGLSKLPWSDPLLRFSLSSPLGLAALLVTAKESKALLHGELTELFWKPLATDQRRFDGAMKLLRSVDLREFDQLTEIHAKITAPVKFIWGWQDPWFALKHCRGMLGSFGGKAEVTVLEHARLLVHEERPAAFSQALREHFETCFA